MRRFLARFSELASSVHAPSWADFITTTPEFKFSVHTGLRDQSGRSCLPFDVRFDLKAT
jgi:hypothetical protein